MGIVKDAKTTLREERRMREALQARLEESNANLDYVAMMTDVEIPGAEEGGEEDAQPEV